MVVLDLEVEVGWGHAWCVNTGRPYEIALCKKFKTIKKLYNVNSIERRPILMKKPKNAYKLWTKGEVKMIMSSKMSNSQLGLVLGRTPHAIAVKRSKLMPRYIAIQ